MRSVQQALITPVPPLFLQRKEHLYCFSHTCVHRADKQSNTVVVCGFACTFGLGIQSPWWFTRYLCMCLLQCSLVYCRTLQVFSVNIQRTKVLSHPKLVAIPLGIRYTVSGLVNLGRSLKPQYPPTKTLLASFTVGHGTPRAKRRLQVLEVLEDRFQFSREQVSLVLVLMLQFASCTLC